MRNTQGRFNICPRPIYPSQVPRKDYSRIIPKSLAELVGMKRTVKGVVIRVVYGRLPEGRGDQWNKEANPTTGLAIQCVHHTIDTQYRDGWDDYPGVNDVHPIFSHG